jgi:Domain of unknown function (DUF1934).
MKKDYLERCSISLINFKILIVVLMMSKQVTIKYQSIILNQDNNKEKVVYNGIGFLTENNSFKELAFNLEANNLVKLKFSKEKVNLKYQENNFKLILNKSIKNKYHTMYGQLDLNIFLKSYEETNNQLKMVYELSQNNEFISKIYLIIYFTT